MERGPESKAQSRDVAGWQVRELPKNTRGKKDFQSQVLGSIQRHLMGEATRAWLGAREARPQAA